jgi:hypothetical protein
VLLLVVTDQWGVQEVAKRIVYELQVRGYRTWFGAYVRVPRTQQIK